MQHREMPVELILEEDPALFFDPGVAGRLFHATFQGGQDRELEHGGAVTCTPSCSFTQGHQGRIAREIPEASAAIYGTTIDFLSGNQLVFDIAVRFDALPDVVSLIWAKGLTIANVNTAFLLAVGGGGDLALQVRLTDTTTFTTQSAMGVVTAGVDYNIQFFYNGEANVGNDTTAIFVDDVRVANDDAPSDGLADMQNTTTFEMAILTTNPVAPGCMSVTEARIRTGTR